MKIGIKVIGNGAVELYHDNVKQFETISTGFKSIAAGNRRITIGSTDASGAMLVLDGDSNGDGSGNDYAFIQHNTDGEIQIENYKSAAIRFATGGTDRYKIDASGHLLPAADSTYNIGSNSVRVANGYFDTLYGDGSNLTGISSGAISSIANDGANRLLTSDGDGTATAHQDFNVANQRLTCRHTSSGTTYPLFLQNRTNGDSRVGIQMIATGSDISDGQFASIEARGQLAGNTSHQLVFKTCTSGGTPTDRLNIDINGHTLPGADNTYNLGSGSVRWANVFTADLKLSNKGSQNDVDSTWGNYTIQEGHEDLFLINHRTGKKFKFNLTEVS